MKHSDLKEIVKNILENKMNMPEENPVDVVTMDVPLFIRLLEYAREDAKTDMDLHDVAEKAVSLSTEGKVLSMEDYDSIAPTEEQMNEDLDIGHQDDEPDMLKGDVFRIGQYANDLYKMLDTFDKMPGEVDFPDWWQNKIHLAADYMDKAKHYLEHEMVQPAVDASLSEATSDVRSIAREIADELEAMLSYDSNDKGKLVDTAIVKYDLTPDQQQDLDYELFMILNKGDMERFDDGSEMTEKKLTKAELKKREEIVKSMKDTFKGPKAAMYAIATDKAKKVAEVLAKKLKEERFKKGTDIGKPGKGFAKIAKSAAKQYGSKEAGERVAGAILKKVLAKKK
jgi:hypothetical protein